MLRSNVLRHIARLALLLPLVVPAAACSDGSSILPLPNPDGGSGGDSAGKDSSVPDTTPPTVISNYPLDAANGESISTAVGATFSKAMNPLSLAGNTFRLTQGGVLVPGALSYSAFTRTMSLQPTNPLALDTKYDATITVAAKDLSGNALLATYSWSFKTDAVAAVGPAPVVLGSAGDFVILAKSEVSNVPTSVITGNIGLSPAAATYITGFALTRVGTKWTSPQVTGGIFAADNDPPTPNDLTVSVLAMQAAYVDAAGRPTPDYLNLGAGTIGGLTLKPGLYKWGTSVVIPTDITIAGRANDTWIFQVSGDLKMSSAKSMILSGGARAKNIVWQVAGFADFGTTSHGEGVYLSKTAIKLHTGASVNGRLYAQTAVTLEGNTVVVPAL